MNRSMISLVVTAGLMCAAASRADDSGAAPKPSRHQMMKECMAKQKASDAGMPKEQMKKNCKDLTRTESENAKVEREKADSPTP